VSGDDGDIGVARLQPNGSPDTTFGNGGIARVSVTPGDTGNTLALQPDGKIVVGGTSGSRVTPPFDGVLSLVRLQGDPGGSAKGKCAGKKATVVGTNGKDKLKGTKKKDVISAGRGKDTVKGLGGNDLICGGKGKDKLVGGPGKDKLLGQQGNDKLLGGPGKDTLKGGPGKKDKVNGGPGKDTEKP
jgi:Ca2+-binding RTX toxin-like protein